MLDRTRGRAGGERFEMLKKQLIPVTKANFYEQSCEQCRNGTPHTLHQMWCAGYDNEHVTCYCEACIVRARAESLAGGVAVSPVVDLDVTLPPLPGPR